MEENSSVWCNGGEDNWDNQGKPERYNGPALEEGPNPYRDGEAIRRFEALYTGGQRRDPKAWMDYFTSGPFLDAAWDRRFAALLLETVTRLEYEFPPSREFLTWLHVAYQFAEREDVELDRETGQVIKRERRYRLYPEANFDGMDLITRITAKGSAPKDLKGNELALLQSFQDYRHLVRLAKRGVWDKTVLEEYEYIVGRYVQAYIRERCEQRVGTDCERHPAGLRVFCRFFEQEGLPEELYRIVWKKLDLKSALLGRAKVLYGPLRELAVRRVPGIDSEVRENYFQLNQARDACQEKLRTVREGEEILDAFFARSDVQRALRSQQFIREQLLEYTNWMNWLAGEGFIRRLQAFYRTHPEIANGGQVVDKGEQVLRDLDDVRRSQAEAQAVAERLPEEPDLSLLQELPKKIFVRLRDGRDQTFELREAEQERTPEEVEEERRAREALEACLDRWLDFARGEAYRRGIALNAKLLEKIPNERDKDPNEPEGLTKEELNGRLEGWITQFGRGELERLELEFYSCTLVLFHSGDQYACFYFLTRYDTWYTLLSQPEVYQLVDSKDVKYFPFSMGMMPSYNIHQSPDLIMSSLNLVFTQIGQKSPKVRVGSRWLWSSTTHLQNGHFKKRMAMQKLAGFPPERTGDYILSKFVLSRQPVCIESVTLAGERTLTEIGRNSFGLAAGALVQFMQKKLARLRLTWTFPAPEGGTYQRHLVLLQDGGAYMMLWLQDEREQALAYAAAPPVPFLSYAVPAGLVHRELKRIRNGLDLLLDDLSCTQLVTGRPGEFVPVLSRPYQELRAALIQG